MKENLVLYCLAFQIGDVWLVILISSEAAMMLVLVNEDIPHGKILPSMDPMVHTPWAC
jgi:hypothetical protein